jgi:hypothetical protein
MFPKGNLRNFITLVFQSRHHKNLWTSWSSLLTLSCRKAFSISAVSAIVHLRNLSSISGRLGMRFGPVSWQSFKETRFGPVVDASNTGQIFVVKEDSFTIGW